MCAAQASEPREAQLIPLRCGKPATSGAIHTNLHPLSRNKCERERDARAQYPIYYAPLHALLEPPRPVFTISGVWDSSADRTSSIGMVSVNKHGRRQAVLHFTMPTSRPSTSTCPKASWHRRNCSPSMNACPDIHPSILPPRAGR
jgi:hypothetical protein